MEPEQYRQMWLSSGAPRRTEPEYAPLRDLGTVLEEMRVCEINITRFNDHAAESLVKRLARPYQAQNPVCSEGPIRTASKGMQSASAQQRLRGIGSALNKETMVAEEIVIKQCCNHKSEIPCCPFVFHQYVPHPDTKALKFRAECLHPLIFRLCEGDREVKFIVPEDTDGPLKGCPLREAPTLVRLELR